MAAARSCNEFDDFVTCTVCLSEFDNACRKPKFLPCSHTLCLACLKEIHKDNATITCPLCRNKVNTQQGDVASLPNNPYALHLLKMKQGNAANTESQQTATWKPKWCLTCGKMMTVDCDSSKHSTIEMTSTTIKNFQSLLDLKELAEMKELGQTKLAQAIDKRKEVQAYLSSVSCALDMVHSEMKDLEEQNSLAMVEMISQLEGSGSLFLKASGSSREQEDSLLTEMLSLVEDSKQNDSLGELKEKMNKSIRVCEKKLVTATALATEIQNQKKSKISIRLIDYNNQSIDLNCPADAKTDFLLLSHLIFTIQKREHLNNPVEGPSFKMDQAVSLPPAVQIPKIQPKDKFVTGKSIFVLTVRQFGVIDEEVHIEQLLPTCDVPFIRALGEFCFQSPKLFGNVIGKACSEIFVLLPVIQNFGGPTYNENPLSRQAHHYRDVGVAMTTDYDGRIGGWSLVFPLQHFDDPRNEGHVKALRSTHPFGRVTRGMDVIEWLSWTSKRERHGYTLTLETR